MTLLSKAEIICLIKEIRNLDNSEEEIDRFLRQLEQGVLDPQISDYIFWSEMTLEEIADKALAYKPISL